MKTSGWGNMLLFNGSHNKRKQLRSEQASFFKNSLKFVVIFTLLPFSSGSGLFNNEFETLIDRRIFYTVVIQRNYHATVEHSGKFCCSSNSSLSFWFWTRNYLTCYRQINCYHFWIVYIAWNKLKQMVFSMLSIFFFNISLIIPYSSAITIDFIGRQRLS